MEDMNELAPVIVVPTKTPDATFKALKEAGYIPIRSDDPSSVVVIGPECRMRSGDLLMSAMAGVGSPTPRNAFYEELHRRMVAREKGETP